MTLGIEQRWSIVTVLQKHRGLAPGAPRLQRDLLNQVSDSSVSGSTGEKHELLIAKLIISWWCKVPIHSTFTKTKCPLILSAAAEFLAPGFHRTFSSEQKINFCLCCLSRSLTKIHQSHKVKPILGSRCQAQVMKKGLKTFFWSPLLCMFLLPFYVSWITRELLPPSHPLLHQHLSSWGSHTPSQHTPLPIPRAQCWFFFPGFLQTGMC